MTEEAMDRAPLGGDKPDRMPGLLGASANAVAVSPDTDAPSRFFDVGWRASDLVVGLGVLASAWGLLLIALRWFAGTPVGWALFGLCFAWMLLFPLWVARRRGWRLPVRRWSVKRILIEAAIAAAMVLALLGVLMGVLLLWILVTGTENIPESTWGNVPLRSVPAMIALGVAAVALAPVFEEVFFRGFLYNALRRWCPAIVAAIHQYNVVVGFDQRSITCIEDLQRATQNREIGDRIRLDILRDGRRVTKEVLLEGFP